MDISQFWKLIEASKRKARGDVDAQLDALHAALLKLDPDEIVAFDTIFRKLWLDAYRWDVWAAAYIIGGGCGDDGFMDFRGWLISRGQKTYENALANPDSLSRVVSEDEGDETQYEGFQYAASKAWEEKTGKDIDDFPCKKLRYPRSPKGKKWSDEGPDLERLCPNLSKKFD